MKKIMIAIAIFCIYGLSATAQDTTWKAKKKMQMKSKKDSSNMWLSDSTMKKNKMWKKGMKDSSKYKSGDTAMPMEKRDTMR